MTLNGTVAIPTVPAARKWVGWRLAAVLAALVVLALVVAKVRPWGRAANPIAGGQFYTVSPMDLEVKIVKDGELQAVRYTDVECKVEGTTQIIWLVKEGTFVKKGDKLAELDASTLQQRKENVDLDLKKAESTLRIAQEMKAIQEMQNSANLEAVDVAIRLAELAREQYVDGLYPQQLENALTQREMARLNLEDKEESYKQTMALYAKGFVTATDVSQAELAKRTAENEKTRTERALRVLQEYTRPMEMAQLDSALSQAKQRKARVLRENASLLAQRVADLEEKQTSVNLLKDRATKLHEQVEYCTITAPEDGLVIYMSSIDRGMREPVQEGAQVRLSQTLMRLPDVRAMKAVLKIQEAQKPKLDAGSNQRALVKILGVPRPIGATLGKVAVLPDNSQRWWNPDLKEYPVELMLDETPQGLKPGTRVDAEIFVDRLEQVVAAPLATIYTVGTDSYVFVRNGESIQERRITLGISNETHVQVSEGLSDGEQVLLLQPGQGRTLLEKAGVKVEDPNSKPSREGRGRRKEQAAL